MTPTYAICISAPICIITFFIGIIRYKRTPGKPITAKGTLPGGGSIEIGEGETPQRRAIDQAPAIDAMVQRIVEGVRGELHQCGQVEAMRGMASRLDATSSLTMALGEDAIASGKNGPIKKNMDRMTRETESWEKMKTEKLFAAGGA